MTAGCEACVALQGKVMSLVGAVNKTTVNASKVDQDGEGAGGWMGVLRW